MRFPFQKQIPTDKELRENKFRSLKTDNSITSSSGVSQPVGFAGRLGATLLQPALNCKNTLENRALLGFHAAYTDSSVAKVVPKRRYGTIIVRCVKLQNSVYIIYTAADA